MPVTSFLRRSADILVAALAIVVLAPLFLVVAVAVRLESQGSIFDVRRELGRKGQVVTFYRFRTELPQSRTTPPGTRGMVTPLGAVLRRYRLDKLPQIWNVLTGELSIVGPPASAPAARRSERVDGRKALRLVGASVREMGILFAVFAPLDAALRPQAERPSTWVLVSTEIVALCFVAIGIVMESATEATKSREDE